MSFILLGILNSQAAAGGESYWFAELPSTGDSFSVDVDSGNNIYALIEAGGYVGSTDFLVAKYDTNGTVLFQKVYGASNVEEARGLRVDASDNVIVSGSSRFSGVGGNYSQQQFKINSSGTVQWQRALGSSDNERAARVASDSSDNYYLANETDSGGFTGGLISKYNSTGSIQFQKIIGDATADAELKAVASDSSGNFVVVGDINFPVEAYIAKFNSSGTIQWQRSIAVGVDNDEFLAVDIDSSGNIYAVGIVASDSLGDDDILLVKYNSSGTVQWQRSLASADRNRGFSVAVDSADDVYVGGVSAGKGIYAKYNSAGTIQFQRTIDVSGEFFGLSFDGNENLLISAGRDGFVAKVPNDGSLTGSYVLGDLTYVYAASSLTSRTLSLPTSTPTRPVSNSSLSEGATSLTTQTGTQTENLVEIG